jgi:hypothetical protein
MAARKSKSASRLKAASEPKTSRTKKTVCASQKAQQFDRERLVTSPSETRSVVRAGLGPGFMIAIKR